MQNDRSPGCLAAAWGEYGDMLMECFFVAEEIQMPRRMGLSAVWGAIFGVGWCGRIRSSRASLLWKRNDSGECARKQRVGFLQETLECTVPPDCGLVA